MAKLFERLPTLVWRILLTVLISSTCSPCLFAQANVQGVWNTLPTQMPINPVHAALMHNGKVLIVSGSGNLPSDTSYMAAVWDPATDAVTTQPVGWDMFCNGMIVLPDGRPFVMGGTIQYDPFYGQPKTSAYDPTTGNFVDLELMAHGRWYPTATTLGDGSVMIFSGLLETGGTNTAVEIYKLGSGWSQQYVASWTPPLYPRMHLLPNGNVFYSGSTTSSAIFNTSTHTWTTGVAHTVYSGTRTYGTSVLLPLTPANGYKPRVIIMGGGNPSTNTTEIIDLSASSPKWVSGPSMSQPRIEMNATILPNGKILATGGSLNDEDGATASLNADLYDPAANTFSSAGANAYARLYHSNSLLLPDATVLLLGSNPARGTYEPRMEIYSPAYLFNSNGSLATRPSITSVTPGVIGYGTSFQLQTPDAASITSAVLIRASAVTHAFDMDQRLVGLSFTVGNGVLNLTGPPNGNTAPPGYYLLFILNSSGVPSVAKFVQVSATPTDLPPTGTITTPSVDQTIGLGQAVSFSGSGTDPDGTISAYEWVFPGGSPSTSALANPGNVVYSTAGSYLASFNVTDNAGLTDPSPQTRTITVVPDFSVSATPPSQTVPPGSAASYTVSVSPGTGFTGTVSFSVSGLPPGATPSFSPATVTTSGSTTLSISTTTSVAQGTYSILISGTSGGLTRTSPATFIVSSSAPPPPNITFMQVNYATPQTSLATVSVPFTLAQTGGDLNVVVVGWNDSTSTVSSVTDSSGNAYSLAVGPTFVSGFLSQSIYYAKNITGASANANTVTVQFNQAAAYPDVRILEYRGVTTLDAKAGASGNSAIASSGPATTTSANELIFGANTVYTITAAAGSGFTSRVITSPDGDIAEDEVVTTAGSNSATATLAWPGPWIMQMVTFSAVTGPAPTVASVSPSTGTTSGGTAVTITGTNFAAGATVTIGGAAATNVLVVNGTTITATTPTGSAGAAVVTVTANGQNGSLTNGFTYVAPPAVMSVSPNTGTTAGGTAVTITGTNFAPGAMVTIGGTAATNVVVASATQITATTPASSAGAATVTVTVNGQSGSLTNGFTYVVPPTVSSVSPNTGSTAGGTAVTITGTNFARGATVTFGGTAATNVVVVSATQITATTPAGSAGAVTVTVTNSGVPSGSLTNGFTYVVTPTVSSISPNNGPTAGGTAVTISGSNFATGATVTIGGAAATNVVVVSGTQITAKTPAHAAGAVTVTVTVNGQAGSLANGFTYTGPPTVTSVSPNNGPVAGGTAVTITGTNFAAGATVTFGGNAATNVVVVSGTQITATTPAGSVGAVTVTVTVNGQAGSLASGFTYNTAVAISFGQVAAATPQSTIATVPVTFPGPQTAGDLNIVVVGWNDTTAAVQSVKDSAGNTYNLAIGPTSTTGLQQSIYYAANIAGGSNTVTVTFNQAAAYPDVRILEYRGVTTLDAKAGASGNSDIASSGPATTTSGNELIFGASTVYTITGAAGSGFTSRIITSPDGDIAEDEVVTTAGSNGATATLSWPGPWVMQMVTFK
jgi:hypothetical protein